MKVRIPISALLSDPVLKQTASAAILLSNLRRRVAGDQAYWEDIDPMAPATYMLLTHDVLRAVVSAGGEIEGLPLWFHVPAAQADDAVPDMLPNNVITDGAGNATPVTWRNWHDATHEVVELPDSGDLLVPSNAWGEELPASVAIAAADAAGVTLKNVLEYKSVMSQYQQTNQP